jgi:hypothetical protein
MQSIFIFPSCLFISVSSTNVWHATGIILLRATCSKLVMFLYLFVPYWVQRKNYEASHIQIFVPIFLMLSPRLRLAGRREWINTVVNWACVLIGPSNQVQRQHFRLASDCSGFNICQDTGYADRSYSFYFSVFSFQIPCNSSVIAVLEERQSEQYCKWQEMWRRWAQKFILMDNSLRAAHCAITNEQALRYTALLIQQTNIHAYSSSNVSLIYRIKYTT